MASSKEERKDGEAASTVSSLSSEKQGQEIREAIVDAFDEAKGNTERAVKEAKKEIPRYREAINNYQEKRLEATREIAENYIDSQKEIFNLFHQSAWVSRLGGNEYGSFWLNWMPTITKGMTQTNASMVSGYLDSIFAATKLTNNLISANMEGYKASTHLAREFSKIAANNLKSIGQTVGAYTKFMKPFGVRGSSIANQKEKR
ncbi:MAG: hypothetical protein ACR2IS_10120, partial [Nitrososphaeraceae archaeon]